MAKPKKGISNFYLIAIFLILAEIVILGYTSYISHSFWYDEAYTIALIKYSFEDIWKITAIDVHPPLYYYMLKAFCKLFVDIRLSMRIFSGLGIIACFLLGAFPIKRLLGEKTALTFMLLLIIMPVTQYLGSEIRMYSWAMFFVLGCAVFAYKVYLRRIFINYILMALFAIGAAYTHYYALVSVGIIYILLSIAILQQKRNIVRLILFGLIVLLAYSPWIPAFISQIQSVQRNFWIETPVPKDYLLFLYYFFSPKEPSHPYTVFNLLVMATALSVMLLLIAAGVFFVTRLPKTKRLATAHAFVFVYILVFVVTLGITYLIKPISVPRYTSCMLGPLLLGVAVYCTELWKHKQKILVSASFIWLALLSAARFVSEAQYNKIQDRELIEISEFLDRGTREPKTMISSLQSYPELAKLSVLMPNRNYYLHSPADETDYRPFEITTIDSIPDNTESYFRIQSINDSTAVSDKYTVSDELILKDKSIQLLTKKHR